MFVRYQAEMAEAAGTFALVFFGCGAIMVDAATLPLGPLAVNAVFGLTVAAMIYAVGHISGGNFNPAVTIALAIGGHFPWRRVAPFVVAQMVGAVAAAGLLVALMGNVGSVGATVPAAGLRPWQILTWEFVMTLGLMLVILGAATDRRAPAGMAPLAIGAWILLAGVVGGAWTGTSMNPARTLGPAIFANEWTAWPLYMAGTLGGAAAAAVLYGWLRKGQVPGSDAERIDGIQQADLLANRATDNEAKAAVRGRA